MMSTYPMQPAPNHSHFFPASSSPAPSTSHYQFPQYWYNTPSAGASFASSSPGKRKRDGSFDDQDSSSSDDGGSDYNRGSHGTYNAPAQRAAPPPARPAKRPRKEWNNSMDDVTSGVGGTRPAGMENGFARMSLLNQQARSPTFVQEPTAVTDHEEPVTKEVHMKTRSWFEPEKDRIVVFDLDGSDTESDTTSPSTSPSRSSTQSPVDEAMAGNGYAISQAYLSRIKGVPQGPAPPPTMNSYRPGALVLYKIPPNFNANSFEVVDDEPLDDSHPDYVLPGWGPIPLDDDRPLYATIEEIDDDDDVEMMEVDGN